MAMAARTQPAHPRNPNPMSETSPRAAVKPRLQPSRSGMDVNVAAAAAAAAAAGAPPSSLYLLRLSPPSLPPSLSLSPSLPPSLTARPPPPCTSSGGGLLREHRRAAAVVAAAGSGGGGGGGGRTAARGAAPRGGRLASAAWALRRRRGGDQRRRDGDDAPHARRPGVQDGAFSRSPIELGPIELKDPTELMGFVAGVARRGGPHGGDDERRQFAPHAVAVLRRLPRQPPRQGVKTKSLSLSPLQSTSTPGLSGSFLW
jgi:hypothetical protein